MAFSNDQRIAHYCDTVKRKQKSKKWANRPKSRNFFENWMYQEKIFEEKKSLQKANHSSKSKAYDLSIEMQIYKLTKIKCKYQKIHRLFLENKYFQNSWPIKAFD